MATPPRFVPTLTEVVALSAAGTGPAQPVLPEYMEPALGEVQPPEDLSAARVDAIVDRVLQRMDAELEVRLTDALAEVVIGQAQRMLPRLRQELAEALRPLVAEAVTQELAQGPGPSAG